MKKIDKRPIYLIVISLIILIGAIYYIGTHDFGTPLEDGGVIYGEYDEEVYKMDKGLDYPEQAKEDLKKAGYKVEGDD